MKSAPLTPQLFCEIRRQLLDATKPKRQLHVLGVEGMAMVLADRWKIDLETTLVAALLHDLAKCMPLEEQREWLDRIRVVPITPEDYNYKNVWHGKVAAQLAKDLFGITEPEILTSVAYHSTGCIKMPEVGMVLFVADFIEPSRKWDGADVTRTRLFQMNLHEAVTEVANLKLEHLREKGQLPHTQTEEMAHWLRASDKTPLTQRMD
ncbi:MAG: bis(5'-nucleosyl)-tetraphosphatase (symmetrical) YqeK [Candidatus Sumerlaeia bacterium]|nr:bis(5'-nucleosyl)-tetraphosphatase (symmetrical) YqeK [Candidatus Sumerlaeia bacterium]